MLRYLKLYLHFLRFSFSRAFEFRIDFYNRIVMDIIFYVVNIGFYQILFSQTVLLGGWTQEQAMIFVGGYLLVDAIGMAVFADNMYNLPHFIQTGELDYYLTRPVSSLFFLSLRSFSASSFVNIILASSFTIWALVQYSAPIAAWKIVLFFFLLINGSVLSYIIAMFFNILVFWFHSGQGLIQISWTMNQFREKPDMIFRGTFHRIMTTVLPYGLMASFPARILFEDNIGGILLHIALVTLLLFLAMKAFWRFGLKNYSSASS